MPAGTVPPDTAVTPLARCAGTGWWGPPPVRRLGTVPRPHVLVPALAGVLLLAGGFYATAACVLTCRCTRPSIPTMPRIRSGLTASLNPIVSG